MAHVVFKVHQFVRGDVSFVHLWLSNEVLEGHPFCAVDKTCSKAMGLASKLV